MKLKIPLNVTVSTGTILMLIGTCIAMIGLAIAVIATHAPMPFPCPTDAMSSYEEIKND